MTKLFPDFAITHQPTPITPTPEAEMPPNIWIVGRYSGHDLTGDLRWEFLGVYDDEALAVLACGPRCFVGPAAINRPIPDEPELWPGSYYPARPVAPPAEV